jgi:NADP-dependent 3-hydroxy acid dehydrogenase YdfG
MIAEKYGRLDILINNAGLALGADEFDRASLDDWEVMIDTNVKGLLYMSRMISPGMVERGWGHIINVCSTAGHEVYPTGNVYCATKHAVDAITKAMRIDLVSKGLRVSQVSPGAVEETEFSLVRYKGDKEKAKIYEEYTPLTSKDVAKAIYFMASQPKHVTVHDIVMTGAQQASATIFDKSGRTDR